MTPEERDRLTRAEAQLVTQAALIAGMDKKLDQLIAAANMGRGAWGLILRIGAFLVGLTAIVEVLAQITGWHR
jgi:hypothetical protein